MSLTPIRRALLSVSDKTGLALFARFLVENDVELISTGGTAKLLKEEGLPVTMVSDLTGFPEIMDGRVKTLHPKVHGGLLAVRDNPEHQAAMTQHGILPIDLVVINLYPFAKTLQSGAGYDACVENIDIGGPAMIRAAAKNHAFVTVVTDPEDYGAVEAEMTAHHNATTLDLRKRFAAKTYAHTAAYDSRIAAWLTHETGLGFTKDFSIGGELRDVLSYGENPHQQAAFYVTDPSVGLAGARQLGGKPLSYNNLNDADAAWKLVYEFEQPAAAIIKHANPCGVAIAGTLVEAYRKALACDPVSAFGGIIALNRPLDGETAAEIAKLFVEVIVAPSFAPEALEALAGKKNLRLMETPPAAFTHAPLTVKTIGGGFLVQEDDVKPLEESALKTVTQRTPTAAEHENLLFAWKVVKHVKSNAIVVAHEGAAVGIGAGQMSRVDSVRIAVAKAKPGSVLASDAFFPFPDGVTLAGEAGVTAIYQPGGSVRDAEVIAEADKFGMAMVLTGMRHFRH